MEKATAIKAILCDVDGVLTDGRIVYDNQGNELKAFNVKDGLIVAYLQKSGILTGVITGRQAAATVRRCEELKFDIQYHGAKDKLQCYAQIKEQFGLDDHQIAYIGDDLNDLPLLSRCGFSACPADARPYIKERVDYITRSKGGEGVLRDVADYILQAQGLLDALVEAACERLITGKQ